MNGYSEAGIHVHVATQNVIYESELLKHWKPTLIMIPVRLGIDSINPIYLPKIKVFFNQIYLIRKPFLSPNSLVLQEEGLSLPIFLLEFKVNSNY